MPSLIGFLNEWEKSFCMLLSTPDENVNKTHWEHVEPEVKAKQTWRRNIKTSSTMPTSASDFFRSQIIDINKMKMVEERKERNGSREKKNGTRYDSVFFSTINRSCYHLSQKARISLRLTQIHFAWREKWNKIKTFNRTSEI